MILSLDSYQYSTLWKLKKGDNFRYGLSWFRDNRRILLSLNPAGKIHQQMYIYNIASRTAKKLGEPIEDTDQVMLAFDVHPIENQLTYVLRKNTVNLWMIENY